MARLEVDAEPPMIIKPARPAKQEILSLANTDQQVFFHVEMLFMYDVRSSDTGAVVDNVRTALSEALVPYYFAAGRFRINEEEKRLEVDCNGAGAMFAGAYCDSTIAELGDLRVPNPDFRKLLVYPVGVKKIEDIPLFSIQVTRFRCGGFIVGIYTSHVLFDGVSGRQFFTDIGRIARGESISKTIVTPDRSSFRTRSPPRITYSHPEMMKLPEIPARLLFNPDAYDVSRPPTNAFKTFSFSLAELNLLKKRALQGGEVTRCSTFEALTAHLWKARTTALEMDPDSIAKLFVVMNIRDKLATPPLPEGYVGNAVVAAPCVDATVSDVVNGSLSFCVRKVQQAIAVGADEEYVRSQMDWCEVNGHGIIDLPGGMIITPWSKLSFDGVDFGWGPPTYITAPVNDRPEYVLVLGNCKGDGGVDVLMAMEFQRMGTLEKCLKV